MATIRNFVLAFGGTGARCVEALAYLAASRSIREPMYVLLVDPDENNGNTQLTVAQLTRYHRLHALVDHVEDATKAPFFSTSLNVEPGDTAARQGGDSFFWKYGSASQRWRELVGHRSGDSSGLNGLRELLYDEGDMEMTFEKGYVGRAHIGALDVYMRLDRASGGGEGTGELTRFLTQLETASKASEGGARLVVLGSIFGGTGASGLPAVPPFVGQHSSLKDQARALRVGCVQLAPYFSFTGSDDPALPDSKMHPVVTQSALFHYGTTPVGYDRVYLVGAPVRSATNDGKPVIGGREQRNRAHYTELAAALAVSHFFRSPPLERAAKGSSPPVFASYSEATDYRDFPDADAVRLRRNLVSFATACALHAIFIAPDFQNRTKDEFMKVMQSQTGQSIEKKNADFETFTLFSRRFLSWMVEIGERAPQLLTPGFAKGIRNLLDGPEEELLHNAHDELLATVAPYGEPTRKSPYRELLHDGMNTVRKGEIVQSRPLGFYLQLLASTTDTYCSRIYQSW